MYTALTKEDMDRPQCAAKLEVLFDPASGALLVAVLPTSRDPAILQLIKAMTDAAEAHLSQGLAALDMPGAIH